MNYTDYRNLVKERGRFTTEGDAARGIRSVLEVLGQRISAGQAEDIAPSLPPEVRPYLRQTWEAEPLTLTDFLLRICQKESIDFNTAEVQANAVLSVLAELIPKEELRDTFEQLPKGIRTLFVWSNYKDIIKRISKLDFINDEQTADAAVKAVLGILASRLNEDQARKLTEKLPEPLTLERLRGHERRIEPISVDYYVSSISAQFGLSKDQASTLVLSVLHIAKEATGDGVFVEIEQYLPSDWAEAIEKA